MERDVVRSLVWYPGVLAAALAGGLVGNLSAALLFVVVGEAMFLFLSLCFTALLAALCAVFAGNLLADDGRRGRLWSVVGVSAAAAIPAALAVLALVVHPIGDGGPFSRIGLVQQATLGAVAVSLISGVAAGRLRRPPVDAGADAPKDARSAVLLVVLASLLMVAGVAIDGMSGSVA